MRQTVIGLGLCALLAGALWLRQPANPAPAVSHHELFAMGTLVQISLADPAPTGLLATLSAELSRQDQRWSTLGDGPVAALNDRLAAQPEAAFDPALEPGLLAAQRYCRESDGRFDPAVGALVRLWGFDAEENFREQPPPAAAIETRLQSGASLCSARIEAGQIHFPVAGVALNFGASAKGRAVDAVIAALRAAGVNNALVNAGGDLKVIGRRAERPWRVGIRHPRPEDGQEVLAILSLNDGEALFTSGDYERYFEFEGRRYHHILNPRSGWPATDSRAATVLHSDAERADAASTALFVAGPEAAVAVMQAMGIELYLLVDQRGEQLISPALRKRLEPGDDAG